MPKLTEPNLSVVADQRRRILAAVPLALARGQGYENLAVERIIALSGVSRRTFYELFEDRADAFRGAYDGAFERLYRTAMEAAAACELWPDRLAAALRSAFSLAAGHPQVASMVVIEPHCVTPVLRRHHVRSLDRFTLLLREGRRERRDGADLPETLEPALLGAVCHVVGAHLRHGAAESLPALAPDLTGLLLDPYR